MNFGPICTKLSRSLLTDISVRNLVRHFSINVAVVGSGPAGFYTTQNLLKNPDIKVDIYEKLPVPFGLVRYGVAPDHAEVKNVINSFTTIANNDRVNFYGNVGIGQEIDLDSLVKAYHAVVLCYGSAQDKLLNIEGELTTKNTISARNFVGWYNGLPADKDLKIDLDCDTACIIGQGNVALDCARILLRPTNIERTDITSYAQRILAKSRIKKIYLIGRRGPLQVSFTTKELRELIRLNKDAILLESESLPTQNSLEQITSRHRRRLTELLMSIPRSYSGEFIKNDNTKCILKFLSKPNRIIAAEGRVSKLEVQKMKFRNEEEFMDESAQPSSLDEYETIDCGLIIRSIGYKAVMIDKSLPVDNRIGAILNSNGRIEGHRSIYCSGWLATGATGVIAGTLQSSRVTAQSLLEDIANDKLPDLNKERKGHEAVAQLLSRGNIQVIHFNDWLHIDELERRMGEALGKPREKFVDVSKMLEAVRHKGTPNSENG